MGLWLYTRLPELYGIQIHSHEMVFTSFVWCLYWLTKAYVSIEGTERSNKEEASDEDEDTEYFDAMEDSPAFITVTASESTQHRSVSHQSVQFMCSSPMYFLKFRERTEIQTCKRKKDEKMIFFSYMSNFWVSHWFAAEQSSDDNSWWDNLLCKHTSESFVPIMLGFCHVFTVCWTHEINYKKDLL